MDSGDEYISIYRKAEDLYYSHHCEYDLARAYADFGKAAELAAEKYAVTGNDNDEEKALRFFQTYLWLRELWETRFCYEHLRTAMNNIEGFRSRSPIAA